MSLATHPFNVHLNIFHLKRWRTRCTVSKNNSIALAMIVPTSAAPASLSARPAHSDPPLKPTAEAPAETPPSLPSPAQRMYDRIAREMDAVAEQFTASGGDPEMWEYYLKLERMMKMAVQMLRLEAQQQKGNSAAKTSPVRLQSTPAQSQAIQTVHSNTGHKAKSVVRDDSPHVAQPSPKPLSEPRTRSTTESCALPQTSQPRERAA